MKERLLKVIYKILASYARAVIAKHDPFVVVVTGSVGKTSTKEAIFKVLSDHYKNDVRKNFGNLNAEIGIPLTILGYEKLPNKFLWPFFLLAAYGKVFAKEYPKYLVLEMGVEHPGDIAYFSSIVRPDIAIVTSASPAHLANFESKEAHQKEKISIAEHIKENGALIVNGDDDFLSSFDNGKVFRIVVEKEKGDYMAKNIHTGIDGTSFRIERSGYKISIKTRLIGTPAIYSFLFAFAVADKMKLPLVEVGKSLERIKPVNGRMNLIEGRDGIIIIDDTYNSNPASARAALDFLGNVEYKDRKVLIFGNMNELGKLELSAHKEIGKYAKDKCDFAIFAGKNAKLMQESYGKETSLVFDSRKELLSKIDSLIQKNDLILVKASQNGNYFEEVVKAIMKTPSQANNLLVRQNKFWQRKKK